MRSAKTIACRGAQATPGLLLLLCLLTLSAGCGPRPQDDARQPSAFVRIDAEPEALRIFVDGAYWGELERWHDQVVVIPSGSRRLELRGEGHYPYRADLELEAERSYTLRVRLVKRYP